MPNILTVPLLRVMLRRLRHASELAGRVDNPGGDEIRRDIAAVESALLNACVSDVEIKP